MNNEKLFEEIENFLEEENKLEKIRKQDEKVLNSAVVVALVSLIVMCSVVSVSVYQQVTATDQERISVIEQELTRVVCPTYQNVPQAYEACLSQQERLNNNLSTLRQRQTITPTVAPIH